MRAHLCCGVNLENVAEVLALDARALAPRVPAQRRPFRRGGQRASASNRLTRSRRLMTTCTLETFEGRLRRG